MPTPHRWVRTSFSTAAAAVALVLAGCAGGPATGTTASTPAAAPTTDESAQVDEFCQALVDVDNALNSAPPVDPSTLPPEEAQAILDGLTATVEPPLAQAEQAAPEEVGADFATLATATRQGLTGDFAAFETPEVTTAEGNVDEYRLTECGYDETAVTATDFEYEGLPDTLPAGVAAITLTNEGEETHEIGMARINDDVTLSAEELLMLPMEEAVTMIEIAGGAFAAPGESDTTFIDTRPGRYVAVCFIPEGSIGDAEGTGPPHFTLGMLGEFTVA